MMDSDWGLVTSFWIDTDAYSDRDRMMFVCGVEFQMVREALESGGPFSRPIHTENESRLRLLCTRAGREVKIEVCNEEWSNLDVL